MADDARVTAPDYSKWLPALLTCAVAAVVLSPVLGTGFIGDDYDLWHAGRELLADPGIVFIGPHNFYRPANAWLFALHHLVIGTWTAGYHTSTLLMHLGCGLLIACLLRRFALGPWGSAAAALLWLISPYTFEPAAFVNISYNDLTVALVWLGLACLWPGPRQGWSRGRLIGAVLLVSFSVFCKESWVTIAALAPIFELLIRGSSLRRALRLGAWLLIPVSVYIIIYALAFGDRSSYYSLGSHILVKIPHLWACFSLVGRLEAYKPGFGAAEMVGVILMAATAALAWWRRCPLIWLGLLWFLLTLLPVLPVSYLPTRYTTVPFAGFILAMAGVLQQLLALCPRHRHGAARLAVVVLVACVSLIETIWLRGEINDLRRVTKVHDALLGEAEAFAPHLPANLPLVCVRLESIEPMHRINAEGYAGVDKVMFIRGRAPYGLVSWPALLSFVRCGQGDELYLDADPEELGMQEYAVVAHVPGGFRLLDPRATTIRDELAAWQDAGRLTRAIVVRGQHHMAAEE